MKPLLASMIVLTAYSVTPVWAEDGEKAKASFDSFAKLVIGGTWTRNDDPGFKHTYKWGIEGKFVHRVGRGGALPDVGMIGIDPATSQMTFWFFNQDGSVSRMNCEQESEGVWVFSIDGKGPDGEHRYRGRASRIDAHTIKEEVVENIVNGKPEKKGEFIWKRGARISTPAEFTEFGELMVGRWASDITLIADWPEFDKKQGDKVNGYNTLKWAADRNAVEEYELIAEGASKGLYFLDAASKTIKRIRITTGGRTSTTTYWKEDGVWQWQHVATQRDGKKVEGAGQLLFEDDGNTMIGDGDLTLDGKPLPHYRDVYRRVGK